MPADPADHPIYIYPGSNNWIGFPYSEDVEIATALSGFEVEMGDNIESNTDGVSEYFGDDFWFGFDTFQPGQGYLYTSASDEVKILVFQIEGSKVRAKLLKQTKDEEKSGPKLDDKQ